jgi:GAF domain-containing protein
MTDTSSTGHRNVYENVVTGATPNPLIENPDAIDEAFAAAANKVLSNAVELIRKLIGAHQSAAAIIVQKDWASIRKFFSLSEKYAQWAHYKVPATGYGIHGYILEYNKPIRLTQAELEAHPEWKQFGNQVDQHPPMRGWLAAPLIDDDGTNWGLIQLSDKYEGDFTAEDEALLVDFTHLVGQALEALWEVRNLKKAAY